MALGENFLPYAREYIEIIQKGFLILPLPGFLYALETSVSALSNVPEMIEPLAKTYELFSEQAVQLLNTENVQEADELREDFFGMIFRYTKYLPSVVLSSKTLEKILQFAETTIKSNQELGTLCMFLEHLFQLTRENPQNDVEKVSLVLALF